MTPNQVTFLRVVAAFAAVAVFSFSGRLMAADWAGIALTVIAIGLDGVDGYIARVRNLATPLGAQLDILGDRVIENLFFTFFAATGLISLWVPVAFFARGATTDFLRGLAARSGRVGFGHEGMLDSRWARLLVASRFSRAAYATLKCVCFCYLGGLLAISHLESASLVALSLSTLAPIGKALTGCSLLFCFLRAIPVIWEGRRFLLSAPGPATITVANHTPISGTAR